VSLQHEQIYCETFFTGSVGTERESNESGEKRKQKYFVGNTPVII
jgi:hypothetical protein